MAILQYWWQLLIVGVAIYMVSNINYAVIFSRKIKHQDIRNYGSGNPGTTNVVRTFGLKMGVLTFSCDLLKGIVAAVLGKYVFLAITGDHNVAEFAGYFFALCATLGHMYPITLKFKGGKGVATSLGALIILNPLFTAICLVGAFIIIILTDKVSIFALLNITAQFVYAFFEYLGDENYLTSGVAIPIIVTMGILWTIIMWAHRGNIKRILTGTENNSGIRGSIFKKRFAKDPKPQSHEITPDNPRDINQE